MTDHTHKGEIFPMASHFPPDVHKRFLGALTVYPQNKIYEGIAKNEQVILLVRKHWIALLQPFWGGVGLVLGTLVLAGAVLLAPLEETTVRYGVVFVWFLFTFDVYYFLSMFLRYVTDVWIVTNERIIDMDTNTIALKSAREVDLFAVAAVEHHRGGGMFFGGLNRGTIAVRIIGEEDYYIPNSPMPAEVSQVIQELAEEAQRRRGASQGGMAAMRGGAL